METKTTIEFNGDGISVEFPVYVKEIGSKFLCYVPGFELTFTADSRTQIESLSKFMVKCFVHQYGTTNEGLRLLENDLISFGFSNQQKERPYGKFKNMFPAGNFMPPASTNVRLAIPA